jgi:transketolase
VTAENHSIRGGLCGAVSETLAAHGVGAPVVAVGIRDEFPHFGSTEYLKRVHGLTADDVAVAARDAIARRDSRSVR